MKLKKNAEHKTSLEEHTKHDVIPLDIIMLFFCFFSLTQHSTVKCTPIHTLPCTMYPAREWKKNVVQHENRQTNATLKEYIMFRLFHVHTNVWVIIVLRWRSCSCIKKRRKKNWANPRQTNIASVSNIRVCLSVLFSQCIVYTHFILSLVVYILIRSLSCAQRYAFYWFVSLVTTFWCYAITALYITQWVSCTTTHSFAERKRVREEVEKSTKKYVCSMDFKNLWKLTHTFYSTFRAIWIYGKVFDFKNIDTHTHDRVFDD